MTRLLGAAIGILVAFVTVVYFNPYLALGSFKLFWMLDPSGCLGCAQ
jgi:hypothetical protein